MLHSGWQELDLHSLPAAAVQRLPTAAMRLQKPEPLPPVALCCQMEWIRPAVDGFAARGQPRAIGDSSRVPAVVALRHCCFGSVPSVMAARTRRDRTERSPAEPAPSCPVVLRWIDR